MLRLAVKYSIEFQSIQLSLRRKEAFPKVSSENKKRFGSKGNRVWWYGDIFVESLRLVISCCYLFICREKVIVT